MRPEASHLAQGYACGPSYGLGGGNPTIGFSTDRSDHWVSRSVHYTNTPAYALYGISDILTAVPEPGTGLLLMTGLLCLAFRQGGHA